MDRPADRSVDRSADGAGRVSAWDVALAAVTTALLLGEAVAEETGSWGPLVLAGAIGSSLAFRRRFPFGSYLVSSAALLSLAGFFYDAGFYPFPNAIALYSVGAYAGRVRAVVGLVLGLGGIVWYWALVPSVGIPWLPGILVAAWALAWVAGQADLHRRRAAADVVRRAREAEERRAGERAAAVAAERTRIAHEVHDIVGHALNVMVLQAGAARRVLDRDPAATAAALTTVESVGRDALGELDGALAALEGPALRRPDRGTADLPELVSRFTAAGVPVTLRVDGPQRPVPDDVGLALYRVAQEALTNVAKHAGGAPAEVVLGFDDDDDDGDDGAVRLRVTDRGTSTAHTGAGPGSDGRGGRGLAGLRDRVTALGGTVEAGPDPRGGWSVRCRLPLDRPADR